MFERASCRAHRGALQVGSPPRTGRSARLCGVAPRTRPRGCFIRPGRSPVRVGLAASEQPSTVVGLTVHRAASTTVARPPSHRPPSTRTTPCPRPANTPTNLLPLTLSASLGAHRGVVGTGARLHQPQRQEAARQGRASTSSSAPNSAVSHSTVFLSYASTDRAVAEAIHARLSSAGIRGWMAPTDIPPGSSWRESVIDAIDQSSVIVVVLSSAANASKHVVTEVEVAADAGLFLLPLRIEEIRPTGRLLFCFSGIQWLETILARLRSTCLSWFRRLRLG